jgi:hypothetical protein
VVAAPLPKRVVLADGVPELASAGVG